MTKIIVQKFGGTSVGSVERIDAVADIIADASKTAKIVVVVSAMAGETNKLVNLAKNFSENPDKREFDALVSTGETVSEFSIIKSCPSFKRNKSKILFCLSNFYEDN